MDLNENQTLDFKSIRKIETDKGIRELAITCVSFANAQGGQIYIGFEDKTRQPLPDQRISEEKHNDAVKRLKSNCFNVALDSSGVLSDDAGRQYFIIRILPSLKTIASTADGRYYIRIADQCVPMHSEDFQRIAYDKENYQWETVRTKNRVSDIPIERVAELCDAIRSSDRVKNHIKQMSDSEILENYALTDGDVLTNLGTLWLGDAKQRSRILYPITVQYIVYDNTEKKVRKLDWHDNTLSPQELLYDIEKNAIELTYSFEVPDGLVRKQIRHYHPDVIRELLINAFAHKSFTISGDIMIKVYPDRLEISNPGGLPLGVTVNNILHQKVRRNPHLIRLFTDLHLMEGEGSGYDLIYELNSVDVKQMPHVEADFNNVTVTQYSGILNQALLPLFDYINQNYIGRLTQKNLIALGFIARGEKVSATELVRLLQLEENVRLRSYVENLVDLGIVQTRGVKKGTQYLVNPQLISSARFNVPTTLKSIEPHRLKALIEEDLRLHPKSLMSEIASRLPDVDIKDIKKVVYNKNRRDELVTEGGKTNRRYSLKP